MDNTTKKCPFCAELIQADAIKCRFCGEFLNNSAKRRTKWYFSTPAVIIAILCLGPLALPLVWLNPRYKTATKILITVLVIAATVLFTYLLWLLLHKLMEQLKTLGLI